MISHWYFDISFKFYFELVNKYFSVGWLAKLILFKKKKLQAKIILFIHTAYNDNKKPNDFRLKVIVQIVFSCTHNIHSLYTALDSLSICGVSLLTATTTACQ